MTKSLTLNPKPASDVNPDRETLNIQRGPTVSKTNKVILNPKLQMSNLTHIQPLPVNFKVYPSMNPNVFSS